jgi:ATP-dependent helicase HrpA
VRNERVKAELNEQLDHLLYPGFLGATDWQRLQQLPRYLKGMTLRLEKLAANPERDQRNSAEVAPFWQQYLLRLEKQCKAGLCDENLEEFRWQIEELRVSLFAQELKTPFPVSVKRLQKLWESVQP